MNIRRPAMFLIVNVKPEGLGRRIVVPVPLLLADATVAIGSAVFAVAGAAGAKWYKDMLEKNPQAPQFIKAIKAVLRELRWAGPLTLVEVSDSSGTNVVVKTV